MLKLLLIAESKIFLKSLSKILQVELVQNLKCQHTLRNNMTVILNNILYESQNFSIFWFRITVELSLADSSSRIIGFYPWSCLLTFYFSYPQCLPHILCLVSWPFSFLSFSFDSQILFSHPQDMSESSHCVMYSYSH